MMRPLLVALVVVGTRIIFSEHTGYLLDDAFITARYGRNLIEGFGFSYNPEIQTYGFTSPAWVLWSALGTLLGIPPQAWLASSAFACDGLSAYLLAQRLDWWRSGLLAALLVSWPALVYSAAGGMEMSLFGLLLVLWWRKGSGMAAAFSPLVRPEGWILVAFHLLRERKRKELYVALPGLGWTFFALHWFGTAVPLSAKAKALIHGGPSLDLSIFWSGHLVALPFFHYMLTEFASVSAGLSLVILMLAINNLRAAWVWALGLAFYGFYIFSGAPIFEWYTAPASLLLIGAAVAAPALDRFRALVVGVCLYCAVMFSWCMQDARADAALLRATWIPASKSAASFPYAKTLMAESAGIVGWHFDDHIYDEAGIVTPEMWKYLGSDGWYYRAVIGLKPDLLIVRPELLFNNEPVAGAFRPFDPLNSEAQMREIFEQRYLMAPAYIDSGRHHSRGIRTVFLFAREGLK